MSDLVDGRMVAADNGWHAEAAADAICMTTGIGRNGEESAGTERNEDVWRVYSNKLKGVTRLRM